MWSSVFIIFFMHCFLFLLLTLPWHLESDFNFAAACAYIKAPLPLNHISCSEKYQRGDDFYTAWWISVLNRVGENEGWWTLFKQWTCQHGAIWMGTIRRCLRLSFLSWRLFSDLSGKHKKSIYFRKLSNIHFWPFLLSHSPPLASHARLPFAGVLFRSGDMTLTVRDSDPSLLRNNVNVTTAAALRRKKNHTRGGSTEGITNLERWLSSFETCWTLPADGVL